MDMQLIKLLLNPEITRQEAERLAEAARRLKEQRAWTRKTKASPQSLPLSGHVPQSRPLPTG